MSGTETFETITVEVRDAVAEIRLNRPQVLNAINHAMLCELDAALDAVEQDDAVQVIVVAGEGRAFSAGFDLKESAARGEVTAEQWRKILEADFELIMRFWDSPKPTIAAVHGHCVGGGFEIALACDVTIAAEDALMGEPEVRFGSGIVALLLPWVTGPKQAKEILLAGKDRILAARAYDMGLVNQVVPSDALGDTVRALAQDIRAGAPTSVQLTKRAINRSYDLMGMRSALLQALELDIHIEASGGPERAAFNEIRREQGLKAALAWREGRTQG